MKKSINNIDSLRGKYERIQSKIVPKPEEHIDPTCLLTFAYEYVGQDSEISIETEEFTAICPWTGMPDFGNLSINYVPAYQCIELKSLKYYLLTYRDVGIVQEHAANRILKDLVSACEPERMEVLLDYVPRGGIYTSVSVRYSAAMSTEEQSDR